MTPEYVRRDELAAILTQLVGRLDAIQANQTILQAGQNATRNEIAGLKLEIANLQEGQTLIQTNIATIQTNQNTMQATTETRLTDVETYQKTLLETYQSTTQAILKQMADSHAQVMEQINEIKQRLDNK
jgi:chromosome segregation ATPase